MAIVAFRHETVRKCCGIGTPPKASDQAVVRKESLRPRLPGFWAAWHLPLPLEGEGPSGGTCRTGRQAPPGQPHPGRHPSLSSQHLPHLHELLKQGPLAHGWKTHLWTASRVAALIERHFGVTLHPEHVRKILRRKLAWASQKPQRRARERHEEQIQQWKERTFGQLKKGQAHKSASGIPR